MAAHLCPNCGHCRMFWSIDEEVTPLTQWHCGQCGYSALEDESKMSTCPTCGTEKSYLLLSDPNRTFWFCLTCQASSPSSNVTDDPLA